MTGLPSNGASTQGATWRVPALALSLVVVADTAHAQAVRRIDVSGYVAERCWTAGPAPSDIAGDPARPFAWTAPARCNSSAAPALKLRLRDVTAQGLLAPLRTEDQALARARAVSATSDRGALEIIVSPTP